MIPTQPAWNFSIRVLDASTSEPLPAVLVEVWDRDTSKAKAKNDLLFVATTNLQGNCAGTFHARQFQDLRRRHIDRGRPDIFFVVKGLDENLLWTTQVESNVTAGSRQFTINVGKAPRLPAARRNARTTRTGAWRIKGRIKPRQRRRLIVECYDKDWSNSSGLDDWLFSVTSDHQGAFDHTFKVHDFRIGSLDKERKPDLYFMVKDLYGKLLYCSEVHSNLNKGTHNVTLDIDNNTSSVVRR